MVVDGGLASQAGPLLSQLSGISFQTHRRTMEKYYVLIHYLYFPGSSAVKNAPAMQEPQEMWVPSLSQEDLLEEGMATHSSVLAWNIPWTEETVEHDRSDLAHMHMPGFNPCFSGN